MLLQRLYEKKLISPPKFLPSNTHYLVMMGSQAYGCSTEDSDRDIFGWCIPQREDIFPHLKGEIPGFGRQVNRFDIWQQHHINDKETGKEYDFQVYSIVKFFSLCMENNPNMVDILFVPDRCVLHLTRVASIVRDNRKLFLHKGSYHKFRGYAFQQRHKMYQKQPEEGSKRDELVKKFGFDTKHGYNLVRLMLECEQILNVGNLDLDRDRETYKAIRRGEWTEQQVSDFFTQKEPYLEECYQKSTLPHGPDEKKIKELLLRCLEEHYGSLDKCVVIEGREQQALREISVVLQRIGY